MSQTLTVKSVQEKASRNDPSKKFWIVADETGAELSTFDASAGQLLPGAVIEAEIIVQGKYKNLKTFTVMKQGTAEPPPPPGKPQGNGTDRDTRIERQVAVKCAFELRESGVTLDDNEKRVYDAALWWVADQLGILLFQEPQKTATKAPATTQQAGETPKVATEATPAQGKGITGEWVRDAVLPPKFKSVGELLTYAFKNGIPTGEMPAILGVKSTTEVKDLAAAATKLLAEIKRRHEKEAK